MDRRAIDDLRRLAALDDELAVRERRLQELDETVRELRGRAEALEAFFAGYDEAERRTRSATESAAAEVERRRAEVGEAKAELEGARDDERRELAGRALARAEDHLSVAEIARGRASTDAAQLEREAADWQRELPLLEDRARAALNGSQRRRRAQLGRTGADRLGVARARVALRRRPATRSANANG